MPISIAAHIDRPVVSIVSSGNARRVEMLAAYHSLREEVRRRRARAVLIDTRDMDVVASPLYASDLIDAFASIIEKPIPVAFLPPVAWTDAHHTAAWKMIRKFEHTTNMFNSRALALEWLDIQLAKEMEPA